MTLKQLVALVALSTALNATQGCALVMQQLHPQSEVSISKALSPQAPVVQSDPGLTVESSVVPAEDGGTVWRYRTNRWLAYSVVESSGRRFGIPRRLRPEFCVDLGLLGLGSLLVASLALNGVNIPAPLFIPYIVSSVGFTTAGLAMTTTSLLSGHACETHTQLLVPLLPSALPPFQSR